MAFTARNESQQWIQSISVFSLSADNNNKVLEFFFKVNLIKTLNFQQGALWGRLIGIKLVSKLHIQGGRGVKPRKLGINRSQTRHLACAERKVRKSLIFMQISWLENGCCSRINPPLPSLHTRTCTVGPIWISGTQVSRVSQSVDKLEPFWNRFRKRICNMLTGFTGLEIGADKARQSLRISKYPLDPEIYYNWKRQQISKNQGGWFTHGDTYHGSRFQPGSIWDGLN